MRSFEALFAAIIVIGFMAYIVQTPTFVDTGLSYRVEEKDLVRHCVISDEGVPLKLVVVKFDKNFNHSCVELNLAANYTYAFSKEFIPSKGGNNITLQIENYNGEPILIYLTNESKSGSFDCAYPLKQVNYTYVFVETDKKLNCGER